MNVSLPCRHCKGSGRVEVPPYLMEVLSFIRISAKTPGFIADKLNITDQAANNRLKKLMDGGLVERHLVPLAGGGRTFLYRKLRPADIKEVREGAG